MKHALTLALLASLLALPGCNTVVGVDNSDTREAKFNNLTGTLVTRYNADIEAVFNATKRTFDQMPGTLRTGETDERGANKELKSVTVFARTVGDLELKASIERVEEPETKAVYTQVSIKYGNFGNLPESQKIISKITSNIRR